MRGYEIFWLIFLKSHNRQLQALDLEKKNTLKENYLLINYCMQY